MVSSCCGSQAGAPQKKDIALQLYSLRDDFGKEGFDATIKVVSEAGYTAIEAAGYGEGKFYGKTPAEFKAAVENAGLRVLSSHTTKLLTDKEVASKDFTESLVWWDECIAAHAAAGMKYIVSPFMNVPKTLDELKTYCNYYNVIGKKCKEKGMSFGYHNHTHEFTLVEEKVMYDYMLENTDPELVFFEMDVYWTIIGKQSPLLISTNIRDVSHCFTSKTKKSWDKAVWLGLMLFSKTPMLQEQNIWW